MTDLACSYQGNRDDALIAYLYDEGEDAAARAEFEGHLATCAPCRRELDALRGVRGQLAQWTPPGYVPVTSPQSPVPGRESPVTSHSAWWNEIPAWAQVAAAMIVLGASAGIANLDVRYDKNGLSVRTGWAGPRPEAVQAPASADAGAAAPWRAELTALEHQLRNEIRAVPAASGAPAAAPARALVSNDADVLRRVRALLDESEKRHQRELALRVGEVMRDVDAARQADFRQINSRVNTVQDRLGVEVYKQRESLNTLLVRASQRQ